MIFFEKLPMMPPISPNPMYMAKNIMTRTTMTKETYSAGTSEIQPILQITVSQPSQWITEIMNHKIVQDKSDNYTTKRTPLKSK